MQYLSSVSHSVLNEVRTEVAKNNSKTVYHGDISLGILIFIVLDLRRIPCELVKLFSLK